MEIDKGAFVSLLSKASFDSLFPNKPLEPQSRRLCIYTGEEIPVLGSMNVDVKYGKQPAHFPLSVDDTGGPNLMGQNKAGVFCSYSGLRYIK